MSHSSVVFVVFLSALFLYVILKQTLNWQTEAGYTKPYYHTIKVQIDNCQIWVIGFKDLEHEY